VLLYRHKALSSNPAQPKTKKYLRLKKYLNGKMSAQHVQSPGFNSPTLLNTKNDKKDK
jgi:hypothetical protein